MTTTEDLARYATAADLPREGQAWRNRKGAVRFVRHVEDDYSVTYSRPAPALPHWETVSMASWVKWVADTGAVVTRKATDVIPKDWSYLT